MRRGGGGEQMRSGRQGELSESARGRRVLSGQGLLVVPGHPLAHSSPPEPPQVLPAGATAGRPGLSPGGNVRLAKAHITIGARVPCERQPWATKTFSSLATKPRARTSPASTRWWPPARPTTSTPRRTWRTCCCACRPTPSHASASCCRMSGSADAPPTPPEPLARVRPVRPLTPTLATTAEHSARPSSSGPARRPPYGYDGPTRSTLDSACSHFTPLARGAI